MAAGLVPVTHPYGSLTTPHRAVLAALALTVAMVLLVLGVLGVVPCAAVSSSVRAGVSSMGML